MFIIFLSAIGGGMIRGLVGWIKHYYSYSSVKFKPGYFFGLMVASGMIGLVSVWAVKGWGLNCKAVLGQLWRLLLDMEEEILWKTFIR